MSFGVAEDHRRRQKLQLTILYRFALYSAASGQRRWEKLHLVVKNQIAGVIVAPTFTRHRTELAAHEGNAM